MNKITGLTATILLSLTFSTLAQTIVTRSEDLSSDVGTLDLNAGISRQQANLIANYYCRLHVPGCGSVSPPENTDAHWEASIVTGVAAITHADAIYIEKHSGEVSWESGPSITLGDLLTSPSPAPKPLNAKLNPLGSDDLASAIKIQFSVLRSGATADYLFLRSSGNLKCDLSARKTLESWTFSRRESQITLVASLKEECMADGARRSHSR